MTLRFVISCATEIETATLVGKLDYEATSVDAQENCRHFFIKNFSCRLVALYRRDSHYVIELKSCASLRDHVLANDLLLALAQLANASEIIVNGSSKYSLEQFAQTFDFKWMTKYCVDECVETLTQAALKQTKCTTLEGVERPFYVGPRLARDLNAIEDQAKRAQEFYGLFTFTQWPADDVHVAKVFEVRGKHIQFCAWAPDTQTFLPPSDYVALTPLTADSDPIFFHRTDLDTVVAGAYAYVDETQCLVDAVESSQTESLIARARKVSIDPAREFA